MEVLLGFGGSSNKNKVCRLKKALYGWKQPPNVWFGRLTKVILALGFKQSQGNHTLFIKHYDSGGVTTLLMYVDDIIVTKNDPKEKEVLWKCLAQEFEMKDFYITTQIYPLLS